MKKLAEMGYVGNDFHIETLGNGFVLRGGSHIYKTKCYNNFNDLIAELAWRMGLTEVGETVLVKGSKDDLLKG